jgi:hypothetical protein
VNKQERVSKSGEFIGKVQTGFTAEEIAFAKELSNDPINQELVRHRAILMIKLKTAMNYQPKEISNALHNRNETQFAKAMNFKELEWDDFKVKQTQLISKWQERFAFKQPLIKALAEKYGCASCNPKTSLDEDLQKFNRSDISPFLNSYGPMSEDFSAPAPLTGCEGDEGKQIRLMIATAICFNALVTCGLTLGAAPVPVPGALMPICVIGWVLCNANAFCTICGC